jgi:hypothetical protein
MGQAALVRARRSGDQALELLTRRRLGALLWGEHAAIATALATGVLLMRSHGWGLGYPRWLALKIALVVFLVVPLEGMHAYVNHVWIRRGLEQTAAPPFSKDLARGIGIDDMLRTLAAPLLGLALPLLVWLSVARPF